MNDVKVHYNSDKPKQLKALAYAQGTDIHVAPGQEKHLPHEAWHVAQQKQGRVQPTLQMKEGVPVNDDPGLEKEADDMGAKAILQGKELFNGQPAQLKCNPALLTGGIRQRKVVQKNPDADSDWDSMPVRGRSSTTTEESEDAKFARENSGIVNMINNAGSVLASVNWADFSAKSDPVGTGATVTGLVGSVTGLSGSGTNAIKGEGKEGISSAAGDIVSGIGSSIGSVVSSVKAIKAAYDTMEGDTSLFTGGTTAAKELMSALKAGFEAAMSIQRFVSGSVSPGIMAAIPGLGIAIAACDVLVNAYTAYSASSMEEEMSEVSDEFRGGLAALIGEPEGKTGLFEQEKRGKMFNRQTYLRLKPGMLDVLEDVRNDKNSVSRAKKEKNFKSKNGIPENVSFDAVFEAIRYYELGSKMQEINQKRKVQGVRNIFTSLIRIAGEIAKFFPADGGITAGVLIGTSAAVGAAQSAAKFIQKQARNNGVLGGDTNRSEKAKHKEYVTHTRTIYQYLSSVPQPVLAEHAPKVKTGEQLLKSTGVNLGTVYATDYSNGSDVNKQVSLIVETMKTGR
ncbi:MAG: DUF4157 domain-containing protein [Bacteroidota bacterium]